MQAGAEGSLGGGQYVVTPSHWTAQPATGWQVVHPLQETVPVVLQETEM